MKTVVFETYDEISMHAAETVAKVILSNPKAALGISVDSLLFDMLNNLAEMYNRKEIDFSGATVFNLYENNKIGQGNENSSLNSLKEKFLCKINLPDTSLHSIYGEALDTTSECRAFDEKIRATGGMDLLILTVGENGQVAYNLPSDKLNLKTHLEISSITGNREDETLEIRDGVITIGFSEIFRARQILLIVCGQKNGSVLKRLLDDQISTQCPATLLKLHSNVLIMCDREAYDNEK